MLQHLSEIILFIILFMPLANKYAKHVIKEKQKQKQKYEIEIRKKL